MSLYEMSLYEMSLYQMSLYQMSLYQMSSYKCCYAKCRHIKCRYIKCRYIKCRYNKCCCHEIYFFSCQYLKTFLSLQMVEQNKLERSFKAFFRALSLARAYQCVTPYWYVPPGPNVIKLFTSIISKFS
jgi:hypothetical protein